MICKICQTMFPGADLALQVAIFLLETMLNYVLFKKELSRMVAGCPRLRDIEPICTFLNSKGYLELSPELVSTISKIIMVSDPNEFIRLREEDSRFEGLNQDDFKGLKIPSLVYSSLVDQPEEERKLHQKLKLMKSYFEKNKRNTERILIEKLLFQHSKYVDVLDTLRAIVDSHGKNILDRKSLPFSQSEACTLAKVGARDIQRDCGGSRYLRREDKNRKSKGKSQPYIAKILERRQHDPTRMTPTLLSERRNKISEIVDGKRLPKCSYCQKEVKGLFLECRNCMHGGHPEHLKAWFEKNMWCPECKVCECFKKN